MGALRVFGGIFAVALFASAIVRYRRRRISRLNLIFSTLIATGIVVLAIAPSLYNPIFDSFNFRPGNGRRLDAVLFIAVSILFLLQLRLQSSADTNERAIRLLVEALAQREFDWNAVAELPTGKRIVTVSPATRTSTRRLEANASFIPRTRTPNGAPATTESDHSSQSGGMVVTTVSSSQAGRTARETASKEAKRAARIGPS